MVKRLAMAFVALEKLHKLYDGYRQRVRMAGSEWLLLQENGKLYCIANQCPHMGAPLHHGTINHTAFNQVNLRCSLHGMEFDLVSGRPINSAGCVGSLRFLPLVYEGNQVGVDL